MADLFVVLSNEFSLIGAKLMSYVTQAIPSLAMAIIIICIGWIIGVILKKIVSMLLNSLKLDDWAKHHNVDKAVGGVPLSNVAGSFVKWYVVWFFLIEAMRWVQFQTIQSAMNAIAFYLPVLLGAAAIVVIGLIVSNMIKNKIDATGFKKKKTLASLMQWIIIYLAVVLGLKNAGLDVAILETAFLIALSAFVLLIAIIVGISFGMSFKSEAQELMKGVKKDMELD
jgi:hypothetical protein